jgi:glycosyltransferase involved in cell wall biosynthesis
LIIFDRPHLDTVKIVDKYQIMDRRIRTAHSTTPGISAALNLGLSLTSNELVARLDCDDVMDKSRLEKQQLILKDDRIVCVGSQLRIIDENDNEIRFTHYPTTSHSIKSSLKIRNVVAHPSVMYRKRAVEIAGGYRTEYNGAEDYDLWIRLSKVGQILNLAEPLTNYRIHDNQYSSKNSHVQIKLDGDVRLNNFSHLRERPGLASAIFINKAINSSGLVKRVGMAGIAMLLNPLAFIKFILWQVIPEVVSHGK